MSETSHSKLTLRCAVIGAASLLAAAAIHDSRGCATRNAGEGVRGGIWVNNADQYIQTRSAGNIRTSRGTVIEGTTERRVDSEAIKAHWDGFNAALETGLGKAVLGGQIKAEYATKLQQLILEEARLRIPAVASIPPKPAEKAGSR